jgi:hypothetical protein
MTAMNLGWVPGGLHLATTACGVLTEWLRQSVPSGLPALGFTVCGSSACQDVDPCDVRARHFTFRYARLPSHPPISYART